MFTPAWLCNVMNNHLDREWFGRENVFNTENADHTWTVTEGKIVFPPQKRRKVPLWQRYVDSRRLEITCGEAPYLVSRYDASTGELILPLKRRIGQLDRKLRIVNENTETYADWAKWALRAYESCYGYEYQGDSLLIARVNLLLTFLDYYRERWGEEPDAKLLAVIAERIAWNLWQMDGLKDTVPLGKPYAPVEEISLFDIPEHEGQASMPVALPCRIKNWRRQKYTCFRALKT
ncbi:MAG: restriction endonuclease subunit M [Mitsuokella sp.]|uniref:restriction endonuclease subunit M n=1 Tax=Mitsuokella sp. TaxID=2049034 RepID=UPI003F1193CD